MRIASSAVVLAIGVLTMLGTPAARARETVSKQALIKFSSERTGSTRSYVIRADGTGLEQLPRGTLVAPNGKAVAHLDLHGDGADLSVEAAGGALRHLDTGGHVGAFSWSPDGTRIVYADRRVDSRTGRRRMMEINIFSVPAPTGISFCSGCVFDAEGGGGLTVFDSWYQSCTYGSYPMPCAFAPRRFDELYRVDGDHAVPIASSLTALAPLSVDGGRVLVDHQDGRLEILSATGASLGTFNYQPGDFRGAKLQGNNLVVSTQGFVDDYAADSATLVHQWPLTGDTPQLEGVWGGVAVYVSGSSVYIVRLADGQSIALPQLGRDPHAQITSAGLFYSYTVDDPTYPGRVAFTPFSALSFD